MGGVVDDWLCIQGGDITHLSPSSSSSEVQRVRLSLMSCMMVVASLYWSSSIWSMSAMASSKACLASWQALLGSFLTSQWKTEQLRARPSLMGWVVLRSLSASPVASLQASWALSPALLCSAPEVYSEMYLKQSPFILQQKTLASALEALGMSWLSMRLRISLQYLLSSPSILALQPRRSPMFLDPFCSSFFSMEDRARQAVLRDPIVFLQATESRLRSSTVRSALAATTLFMASSMSSKRSVCSVILAMQRCSSRVLAVIDLIQIKQEPQQKFQIQTSNTPYKPTCPQRHSPSFVRSVSNRNTLSCCSLPSSNRLEWTCKGQDFVGTVMGQKEKR